MDILKNLQAKQEQIQQELASLRITHTSSDGAVTIVVSGTRQIIDVAIKASSIDLSDMEQLQDLIVLTTNDALEQAKQQEASITQSSMMGMLAPGLGDLL